MGDFNLRYVDWELGRCPRGSDESYLEWIQSRAIYQHVKENTKYREGQQPSLLDLIITAQEEKEQSLEYHPPIGKSHHLLIKMTLQLKLPKPREGMCRNFGRIDVYLLRAKAAQLSWHSSEPHAYVEESWSIIKNNLMNLQDEFALLTYKGLRKKPLWWHAAVGKTIKRRNRSRKAFRASGSQMAWREYTRHCNEAVSLIRKGERDLELKLASRSKREPRRYYRYAKARDPNKKMMGPLQLEGRTVADDQKKVDAFCTYFSSVHEVDRDDLALPDLAPSLEKVENMYMSLEVVHRTLAELNVSKSPGPDGIHPVIVKPWFIGH
ncbi:unnamed protein product [Echinostoma caproni]|uniref:Endo/exonuclease/phosphatase domain-containing protein n=1 Tax=Echinostoma caproni TaxID=27848 RepID=A0A183AVN6_9TREM|nr:unnamed protein product [Echinostoma caproni]